MAVPAFCHALFALACRSHQPDVTSMPCDICLSHIKAEAGASVVYLFAVKPAHTSKVLSKHLKASQSISHSVISSQVEAIHQWQLLSVLCVLTGSDALLRHSHHMQVSFRCNYAVVWRTIHPASQMRPPTTEH